MPANRILVDLTTAFDERNTIPHGTTRVERKLIEALARLGRSDIAFCRFDKRAGRFIPLSTAEALAVATTVPVADSRRAARVSTRRYPGVAQLHKLELWFRKSVRDPIRQARSKARIEKTLVDTTAAPDAGIFDQGTILLLPGELQRQDFGLLMSLRRKLNVRLVFVFYDLLDTLTTGDPRLRDPDAADVPGSNFVMREGSLILPISHYSEGELRKYADTHGIALPAIKTIRLGHQIAEASAIDGVDDLIPGQFVLTVGDVNHRKNHSLLTGIWASLARERSTPPIPLVIAGRIGTDGQPLVAAVKSDPAAAAVIRFLSDVDDAKLQWLYRNCRFTLFPSRSEGFGLPVVESFTFGKPCIASNTTSIPEASQGLATHLGPDDAAGWRTAIARLLDDDAALASDKAEIAIRFRLTSWTDTANDVLAAIADELQKPEADGTAGG